MVLKFTNSLHCKTLQNAPKFGLFGLKIYHLATLVRGRNFACRVTVLAIGHNFKLLKFDLMIWA
jgi:hypothetical protein